MIITCCINCEERHVGCHAECQRYKVQKAKKEQERKARFKETGIRADMASCYAVREKKRRRNK